MKEKEKELQELKEKIKEIKLKGSFKKAYQDLRKGTININKLNISETEKKKNLVKLCNEIIKEME